MEVCMRGSIGLLFLMFALGCDDDKSFDTGTDTGVEADTDMDTDTDTVCTVDDLTWSVWTHEADDTITATFDEGDTVFWSARITKPSPGVVPRC
jgi:hypothetical protein